MFEIVVNMEMWLKIILWIGMLIMTLLLFSFFEKKENKIFKFLSIIFAFLILGLILVPILVFVSEGFNQLKVQIIKHFSEFIAVIALLVSIISLAITNLIFNKKVLIAKGSNDQGVYIEISNTSNKDIEILKFYVDGTELIANEDEPNVKTPPITIDDITYMMFNRNGNVKVCKGSGVKIQYLRNAEKNDFKVLRFSIDVEYRTLGIKRVKTIMTDLSPFI